MKKTNFLAIVLIGLSMLLSCDRNSQADSATSMQDSLNALMHDSLSTALAEKDSLMALMNEISEGMNQIKDMEQIVSSQDLNAETPDRKAQLRNDMMLIQKGIADRKARLAELEKRLKESTSYSAEMQKTVETMKKQLENQEKEIASLTEQLRQAHIQIENLSRSVDSLNVVNTEVNQQREQAEQHSEQLANELNTCFYVIGTNKELKKQHIIEKKFLGKSHLTKGDFEKTYFTKTDKRTFESLPLHSKKVKIYSVHPSDSYQIVDEGGSKTLRITNPARFWERSNYLVIQID